MRFMLSVAMVKNPAPAPAGFANKIRQKSGSGRIWKKQIRYNPTIFALNSALTLLL